MLLMLSCCCIGGDDRDKLGSFTHGRYLWQDVLLEDRVVGAVSYHSGHHRYRGNSHIILFALLYLVQQCQE